MCICIQTAQDVQAVAVLTATAAESAVA